MKEVVELIKSKGFKIATAESITGGRISNAITNVPGSSNIFSHGYIVYSDQAKIDFGVDPEMIKEYTSVSKQVALELTKILSSKTNADICISVTGEAGPVSAVAPVGRVFIALNEIAFEFNFGGSRSDIKRQTTEEVFKLIERTIK